MIKISEQVLPQLKEGLKTILVTIFITCKKGGGGGWWYGWRIFERSHGFQGEGSSQEAVCSLPDPIVYIFGYMTSSFKVEQVIGELKLRAPRS